MYIKLRGRKAKYGKSKIWINDNQSVHIKIDNLQKSGEPVNIYLRPDLSEGWWIYRKDVKDKKLKDEEALLDRIEFKKGDQDFVEIIDILKEFRLHELEEDANTELTKHDKRFKLYQTFRASLLKL